MIKDFDQLSLNSSQGHPLYDKDEHIDFSFITPLLGEKYSIDYGRPAYSPEVMIKLLFLKILYRLSDERVIQEAQVNMAYKYFLNLEPDNQLMHPSSLTKFRKLRLSQEDILEELLLEIVSQAIEKRLFKSKTLILDATHTRSKYTTQPPLEILRQVSKNIRKQLYRYVPHVKEEVPKKQHSTASLEEEVAYTQELIAFTKDYLGQHANIKKPTETALQVLEGEAYQQIRSLYNQEAKLGHKSLNESFTVYKSHLAMTDERLITAIEVTTGEVSDGKYLNKLVEQSKKHSIQVNELLADAAYSSKENLEYMKQENIIPITSLNPIVLNDGKREIKKMTHYFDIEKCKICPLREGCYKPGAKSKTYSITLKSEIHQKAIHYQKTDEFKEKKNNVIKLKRKTPN